MQLSWDVVSCYRGTYSVQLSWDALRTANVGRGVCRCRGTYSVQISWDVECAAVVGRIAYSCRGTSSVLLWDVGCAAIPDWLGRGVCSYRGTWNVMLSWDVECAAIVGRGV